MSRTDSLSNMSYRRSISFAAHLSARIVFLASVITGVSKWGILLYRVSSTRFGSINMNFKSSGPFRYKREVIIEWILTDFPEPVVPATKICGIFARLPKTALPEILRPRAVVRGLEEFWNLSSERRVARPTIDFDLFGISIPTRDLPG